MNAPCFGCEHNGCGDYHDRCPEYQKYKQEQAKIAKKKREEMKIQGAIVAHIHSMRTKSNSHKVTKSPKK